MPLKGNLDGLRYIFDGIQVNMKAIPDNPNLVKEQYAKLSQNLGYDIQPSEAYLEAVFSYLKRTNDEQIQQQFKDYMLSIYPKNH